MAENPPDHNDDALAAIEKLANPATSLPNGKIAGAGCIAAAKKAVVRLQKLIDESEDRNALRD
jgi:hypothetical protein